MRIVVAGALGTHISMIDVYRGGSAGESKICILIHRRLRLSS